MDLPDVFAVHAADPHYSRSRSASFVRPHRGVRIAADAAPDLRRSCRAALLTAPPGSAVSGRTAATVCGFPLPPRYPGCNDTRVQVTAPAVSGGPTLDSAGIECRLCLLPPEHVTCWDGILVTTPARTYLDLAADLGLADLVAIGDVILRRRLTDLDGLRTVVAWARRRRGVGTARTGLGLLDARTRSPQESRLRVRLALAKLPPPEVNAVVLDRFGGFLGEGDLVWRAQKVLVDYDGEVHRSEQQRRKDAVRRNQLQREGWLVLVYTADVLARHPDRIVAEIAAALRTRG
jgi:hypothetical protein